VPVKKIAISVPEDVVRAVDRVARRRRTTRSALISQLLRQAARAHGDAELKRIIDELFAEPEVVREQVETAEAYGRAGRPEGTEW
jgi:metal-responsive CopG/Arc/MetJ family transcriptional regulator